MWFVPWRRRFGNWNSLAAVRAVDCDVPLIGLYDHCVVKRLAVGVPLSREQGLKAQFGHEIGWLLNENAPTQCLQLSSSIQEIRISCHKAITSVMYGVHKMSCICVFQACRLQ